MYLCSELVIPQSTCKNERNIEQAKPQTYPLCNVINAAAAMGTRLRSLGYRQGKILQKPENYAPFIEIGKEHFGVHYKNVFASYLHFYFAHLF